MSRLRNWCFTSYDLENLVVPDETPDFRYCVYQVETCPETGRWHIQGYIEFKKALHMAKVKELLRDPAVHLEARRGTRAQARQYCMKEDSRVVEPIEFGIWDTEERARTDLNESRVKIQAHKSWQAVLNDPELCNIVSRYMRWAREVYDNRPIVMDDDQLDLYPWQNEVMDMITEDVPPRRVIWIWSQESGTGKSTFFDYVSRQDGIRVLPGADFDNTLYAYDGHDVIWFDLTRAQSHDYVPYHALEKFSNRTFHLSKKYTCVRKLVKAHIVVTANIPPDESKLPQRCKIILATTRAGL